ncbi:MAG: hypothetical protein ABII18_11565 [bacterium]|nr:hypothetical protein [bacterium]MBU1919070.1 hypothetical protein [bacterium]
MAAKTKKEDFEWKKGETLDDKNYTPMGDVRVTGLPKVKRTALHADPEKRKKERDHIILSNQSKPYHEKKKLVEKDTGIIVEESQSGLSEAYEDSRAKKLIDHGKQLRGVDRFGKKK